MSPVGVGAPRFDNARDGAIYDRLKYRKLTNAGTFLEYPVAGAAVSVTVAFAPVSEVDNDYVVFATPSWNSWVWCASTDKTTTGCTIHFGVAAPGGGGTVDVIIERTER